MGSNGVVELNNAHQANRMGQAKSRKQQFLTAHPTCCFCGGVAVATSIDHQPARTIFLGREWPEGYEFPACDSCNQGSSTSELVAGLITRLGETDGVTREAEDAEFMAHLRGVRNNAPASADLVMSEDDVREWLRSRNVPEPSDAALTDIPVVRLPPEAARDVRLFGSKLALALHYKHTGIIVPRTGGVALQIHTNERLHFQGPLEESLRQYLKRRALIRRNGRSLESQFGYIYGITADLNVGVYYCAFRRSIAILMVVAIDPAIVRDLRLDPWYRPGASIP